MRTTVDLPAAGCGCWRSLLLGGGGVVGMSFVKSPQEHAAEQGPPEPSILSAVVERRVLTDTVVVRGLVAAAGTFQVVTAGSVEGRPVVTGVRTEVGAEVPAGQVLLEVSGRPLFALPGAVPAYRDLRPGAEGADVEQLQRGLGDLGFDPGAVDGVFGSGTKRAVREFYDSIGFAPVTTGDEDAVAAARKAVTAAERAVAAAEDELELAQEAAAAATGPPAPGTPDPVEQAERQVELAREDLAEARSAHADAVEVSGPIVPLGEYVFAPGFPARVQELTVRVGDEPAGPVLTLSSGELVVTARVDPAVRELLEPGMAVDVLSELSGLSATGTIAVIGEAATDEVAGFGHEVTIQPDQPLPAVLAGQDVRVTVTAASTPGPVLVVPVSAVSAAADGTTVVVRLGAGGGQERVVVTAGVSGDGYVEVRPAIGGALVEGDRVVTGQ